MKNTINEYRKKIFIVLLVVCLSFCSLVFTACKKGEEKSNAEKIMEAVGNFDVEKSNGYTYTVEQKANQTIVNSKKVTLRLYRKDDGNVIGKREEQTKTLNENIDGEQFITTEKVSYFKDGQCYEGTKNGLVELDCTYEDFSRIVLTGCSIGLDEMKITKEETGKSNSIRFEIEDEDAASILGITTGNIRNLNFYIVVSEDYETLVQFDFSYTQNKSTTKFSVVPYYKNNFISMPQ